ncbi:hypothetical protein TI05_01080 [Achromatium sp. WMS3]|nr:hypothetical protein TI05_01080 [Achromatium sp. WMS3]
MNKASPTELYIQTEEAPTDVYPLAADADGIPVLDQVVEDTAFDTLADDLKAHILLELEPLLQNIVQKAFTDSVRLVALDLKHAFERELSTQLDTHLRTLVEQIVQQAFKRSQL